MIIVAIGINSPMIVITWGWRDLYFLTAGISVFAWLMVMAWVPETRWMRTEEELSMLPQNQRTPLGYVNTYF